MDSHSLKPLQSITDLISSIIPSCGSDERMQLWQAQAIFRQCLSEDGVCLDQTTEAEVIQQIEWVRIFQIYRSRYPTYSPLHGHLVPKSYGEEDPLLLRFADEILEGARTIADLLQVRPLASWTTVERRQREKRILSTERTERRLDQDVTETESDDSDLEIDNECVEYNYAYF